MKQFRTLVLTVTVSIMIYACYCQDGGASDDAQKQSEADTQRVFLPLVTSSQQKDFQSFNGVPASRLFDAAFYYPAHLNAYYFFHGSQYIKVNGNGELLKGYPKNIIGEWGIPSTWNYVDSAIFSYKRNAAYFFRGNQYTKLNLKNEYVAEPGYPRPIVGNWGVPKNWDSVNAVLYSDRMNAIYMFKDTQYTKMSVDADVNMLPGYPKDIAGNWGIPASWNGAIDMIYEANLGRPGAFAFKGSEYVFIDTTDETTMKKVQTATPIPINEGSWDIPMSWSPNKRGFLKLLVAQSLDQTWDKDGTDDINLSFINSGGDKIGCKVNDIKASSKKQFSEVYIPCVDTMTLYFKAGDNKVHNQTIPCVINSHTTIFNVEQDTQAADLVGKVGDTMTDQLKNPVHQIAGEVVTQLLKSFVAANTGGRNANYGIQMVVNYDTIHNTVSSNTNDCKEEYFSASAERLGLTKAIAIMTVFMMTSLFFLN